MWWTSENLAASTRYVAESQYIEGEPFVEANFTAHAKFWALEEITSADLVALANACTPRGAALRNRPGMDVQVGGDVRPRGGPMIEQWLAGFLHDVNATQPSGVARGILWRAHCEYENVHPLTDGNGRTGRALVLWMANRLSADELRLILGLGFLHWWYYATLGHAEGYLRH